MRVRIIPVLVLAAVLLTGCAPGTPGASGTGSPSVAPSASASGSPTSGPTESPDAIPADLRETVVDAMNSGNTAAIEGYLAPSVFIIYAASEYSGDVTDHALIVDDLSASTADGVTWDFDLPADLIDKYRSNPGAGEAYAPYFPENALVGKSSADRVLSFTVEGGLITAILFADEYSLIFE
jgi:hypothetical protein